MTHPVLYKRTKTGAIQSYRIWVENKVSATGLDYSVIFKETGQLEGKKIVHEETVLVGKNLGRSNETTPYEQAVLQAKSDWQRKKDEGYKSLEDLGSIETEENWLIDGTMQGAFDKFYRWLDGALPKFNSDANGQPKPMLAKTVDWKKVTYPCLVQPKLDGVRCLMVVHMEAQGDGKQWHTVVFLSRSGKEYTTLGHIAQDVHEYLFHLHYSTSFILDGEIYSDELTFQKIVAAVKKQRSDSLKLKFRAYDVVNNMNQKDRWAETVRIVDAIASPLVWPVTTFTMNGDDEIKFAHDTWVKSGYEGAMIRLMDGHYGQGQRSSHLLKVKVFNTSEFTFVRFEQGQREEDLIAVCGGKDGVCFKAKVVGTKKEKEKLRAIPARDIEYKQYTIRHFGWTDSGLPRFPIGVGFRDYE